MNFEILTAPFLTVFIAIGLTMVLPVPFNKSMKPTIVRNGALSFIFSAALSFCTAARNILGQPWKGATGRHLPVKTDGRSSVCPCSGRCVSLEEGHAVHAGTERTNGKAGTTRPLRAVAFRRRPSGAYINGSGAGRTAGGQAHCRKGRASP